MKKSLNIVSPYRKKATEVETDNADIKLIKISPRFNTNIPLKIISENIFMTTECRVSALTILSAELS